MLFNSFSYYWYVVIVVGRLPVWPTTWRLRWLLFILHWLTSDPDSHCCVVWHCCWYIILLLHWWWPIGWLVVVPDCSIGWVNRWLVVILLLLHYIVVHFVVDLFILHPHSHLCSHNLICCHCDYILVPLFIPTDWFHLHSVWWLLEDPLIHLLHSWNLFITFCSVLFSTFHSFYSIRYCLCCSITVLISIIGDVSIPDWCSGRGPTLSWRHSPPTFDCPGDPIWRQAPGGWPFVEPHHIVLACRWAFGYSTVLGILYLLCCVSISTFYFFVRWCLLWYRYYYIVVVYLHCYLLLLFTLLIFLVVVDSFVCCYSHLLFCCSPTLFYSFVDDTILHCLEGAVSWTSYRALLGIPIQAHWP